MKLVNLFKKDSKPSFEAIIERAQRQRDSAMQIFINSKQQLVEANETITETTQEVSEAMGDLEATQKLLIKNRDFNEKLIGNIERIIE